MTRVCALMAVYNEEDIVREAVSKLINQGVDVHLVDNASTDGTVDQVADLVGRGLVDIETLRFHEDGREVYNWTALLQHKEALSRQLGYDWYLHVDADEIRYAPWPELSLREGVERVDAAGYNLINFKLFNFRLSADTVVDGDVEAAMQRYSPTERFNQRQVKAWKSHPAVDLASLGGHHVWLPDSRVYPTRFIHKHYPVRSLAHGQRKILAERKARFSQAERRRGWHVQYDALQAVDAADIFWDPAALVPFDAAAESRRLFEESSEVLSGMLAEGDAAALPGDEARFQSRWLDRLLAADVPPEHAHALMVVADHLARHLAQQDLPPVSASPVDGGWLTRIIASMARLRFLSGDPLLWGRLGGLRFG